MELIQFLNKHENWQELLALPPYNLRITQDGDYTMLKYQQFNSNMGLKLVQQARGVVVRQNPKGEWVYVVRAMDKFFNAGESYAAQLDWEDAYVSEKLDGSLIKVAWDELGKQWLVSTNGTIDARKAPCNELISFYDAFVEQIERSLPFEMFLRQLAKNSTYYFELVSPHNQICVHYSQERYGVYYLGQRNMYSMKESKHYPQPAGTKLPKIYAIHSLEECIAAAQNLPENNEGYVVHDSRWNRIKVKSPWYVAAHHLRGEGTLTTQKVIEMWQNDQLDDFVAYFPEHKNTVNDIMEVVNTWIRIAELNWETIVHDVEPSDRKRFAASVSAMEPIVRPYLFARLDGKTENATTFFKNTPARKLSAYYVQAVKEK